MKTHLLITAAVALALAPAAALAQNDTSGASPSVTGLKGPPNANGYDKNGQGRSASEGAGTSTSNGTNMKGPPNADGAARATGNDSK